MNSNEKPLILMVNDDGVHSPGLAALAEVVEEFGELLIVAPKVQQTSMGRSYPRNETIGVIEKTEITLKQSGRKIPAYSVVGSPAYATAYAVMEVAERKPDLCLSGINYGENMGTTLSYSGTVGAALEAADFGIPSLAFSRPTELSEITGDTYAEMDWSVSAKIAAWWTEKVLREGMPFNAPVLNINVPQNPSELFAYRYTRQSRQQVFSYKKPQKRDFSKPFILPSYKREDYSDAEPNSDIYAVNVDNITSVTPIANDFTLKSADI